VYTLIFVINVEFEEIFNSTIDRDKHLWKMADENSDGYLDEKEFLPFQHPEHNKATVRHIVMRFKSCACILQIRVMVRDLIKMLDEDKDGRLSEEEFMEYYQQRSLDYDKVYILIIYMHALTYLLYFKKILMIK